MRRVALVLGVVVVLILGVVAASGYLIRGMVTGSRKQVLLNKLSERAGVKVDVDDVDFDVASWYRLQPSVTLGGVKMGNPPGYKSPHLMTAQRISLQVALKPLLEQKLEVGTLRVEHPQVLIERSAQGVSNLEAFAQGMSSRGATGTGTESGVALEVKSLEIRDAELKLVNGGVPRLHGLNITLADYVPGQPLNLKLEGLLYDGKRSKVSVAGRLGPFGKTSAPLEGTVELTLALADVPDAVRKLECGDLLAQPGEKSAFRLNGAVKGDLYSVLQANGKVTVEDLQIGRGAGHLLPLRGEAPVALKVTKLMSTPVVDFRTQNATLQLGGGEWKGNVQLLVAGGVVRGTSAGSIKKVNIDQFLSALTSASERMEGQLEIPAYALKFAGKDATELQKSLAGEGSVTLVKGRLKALDLVASIRRSAEKTGLLAQETGTTEFSTLRTNLHLENQELRADNLVVDGPAVQANGAGVVGFDQSLRFKLSTLVRGPVAELLGFKKVGNAPAEASVPVEVKGTVQNPQVVPNVGKMAVATGMNYLKEFVKKTQQTGDPGKSALDAAPDPVGILKGLLGGK